MSPAFCYRCVFVRFSMDVIMSEIKRWMDGWMDSYVTERLQVPYSIFCCLKWAISWKPEVTRMSWCSSRFAITWPSNSIAARHALIWNANGRSSCRPALTEAPELGPARLRSCLTFISIRRTTAVQQYRLAAAICSSRAPFVRLLWLT